LNVRKCTINTVFILSFILLSGCYFSDPEASQHTEISLVINGDVTGQQAGASLIARDSDYFEYLGNRKYTITYHILASINPKSFLITSLDGELMCGDKYQRKYSWDTPSPTKLEDFDGNFQLTCIDLSEEEYGFVGKDIDDYFVLFEESGYYDVIVDFSKSLTTPTISIKK
jgi:hypothetical protein